MVPPPRSTSGRTRAAGEGLDAGLEVGLDVSDGSAAEQPINTSPMEATAAMAVHLWARRIVFMIGPIRLPKIGVVPPGALKGMGA